MLALAIMIMNEYKPLLVKFQKHVRFKRSKKIKMKCSHCLMDVQIHLVLACIIPMLLLDNKLIKYIQKYDVFVCDYLARMKKLQVDL
jgi:hypothetical protein